MNDPLNDPALKARFQQLRDSEARSAPSFASILDAARTPPVRHRFRPAPQWAAAALVVLVAGVVLIGRWPDSAPPGITDDASLTSWELDDLDDLDMPTDFLLETPWFDLASTTPNFDPDIPLYTLPEDPSDET